MIAIVDYGVGNLFSLRCSLEYIGAACEVTGSAARIAGADAVILPGVGAFGDAAQKLRASALDRAVYAAVEAGKPLLGICLGMQMLYEKSDEYGEHKGLGLLDGNIEQLTEEKMGAALKVPHMGWNDLVFTAGDCALLRYNAPGDFVYYVHSFYAPVSGQTAAYSSYGNVRLTGVAQKGNVYGTQFHPEKSGEVGLAMLRAFAELEG